MSSSFASLVIPREIHHDNDSNTLLQHDMNPIWSGYNSSPGITVQQDMLFADSDRVAMNVIVLRFSNMCTVSVA